MGDGRVGVDLGSASILERMHAIHGSLYARATQNNNIDALLHDDPRSTAQALDRSFQRSNRDEFRCNL